MSTAPSCVTSHTATNGPKRVSLPRDTQTFDRPFPQGVSAERYRQMRPYLLPQKTDASCSAASMAVIINALRGMRGFAPVDERMVAETDPSWIWSERIRNGGNGLDLDSLRLFALKALTTLSGPSAQASVVDVVHMPAKKAGKNAVDDIERQVAYVLSRSFAAHSDAFVVANVLQSKLFRGGEVVGHFVLIGAYDEAHERVLILDVDSLEGLEPYWVTTRTLIDAMQGEDDETGETRGLLWIHS